MLCRFLLPVLQIRTILDQTTRREMRKALKEMPKGLDSTFEETLRRIERQPDSRAKLAKKVLMWISHAKQPLRVRELQHALAVEIGDTSFDVDGCPLPSHMVHYCLGLITIDEESSTIRLVHFTVQEYFLRRQSEIFLSGEHLILSTCLTYLSFDAFRKGDCDTYNDYQAKRENYPFLEYAASHWIDHGWKTVSDENKRLAFDFLTKDLCLPSSQQIMEKRNSLKFQNVQFYREGRMTALHIVAKYGFHMLVQPLLDYGAEINSKKLGGSPLILAAGNGHELAVDILLENGADVNFEGDSGSTALHVAASGGFAAVAQKLLDKGAKIDTEFSYHGTPLCLAAGKGHEATVKVLLNRGATPNGKDIENKERRSWEYPPAPLSEAAKGGNIATMTQLLDRGADIDGYGGLPLKYAVKYGHMAAFKFLISKGANFMLGAIEVAMKEFRDDIAKEILELAASNDTRRKLVPMVRSTLERWPESRYRSTKPLMQAISTGDFDMVQFLLDMGCSPSSPECPDCLAGFMDTPLKTAAYRGDEKIVRLLLDASKHVDCYDAFAQTPLYWASRNGHEGVVRLLLDSGATQPPQTRPGWYGTPVMGARLNGHSNIIRLLESRNPSLSQASRARVRVREEAEEESSERPKKLPYRNL
jgi:ankyrin repeat protein